MTTEQLREQLLFAPKNGYSKLTEEQRMEMELSYVDRANFWWDIKIIFATFGAVLRGDGAK